MGSRHRRSSLSSSSSSCSSVKSSVLLRRIGNRNTEMDNGRSSAGGGSIRIHHLTASTKEGVSRFPKLEECAHFHYEHVELAPLQVSLYEQDDLKSLSSLECNENSENKWLVVQVVSQGQNWLLRRSYENFRMLDQQLHQCIYDRKFSALPELPPLENLPEKQDPQAYVRRQLIRYCERFSCIAGSLINCGPVLSWFQLDNRGRRILVTDDDNCPINTPAVAAAYAIKKYTAIASDEISFDIGDMISVIDMPPPEDSIWWRGKRGFLVGFFPSHCVAVITDKVPRNLHLNQPGALVEPTKPVLRKHGKLIAFFRAFILSRPSRRHLKQAGILKERVFGCDLGEHLSNTGRDIPMVLKCCTEFIEQHGIVDGIYRLSGVTSNIQKLRITFDEDRMPILYNDENILQDIHSVASLLKMYFRELPNPLCTYQLYKSFVAAVQHSENSERIILMRDTVQKLPPPHYRTLEYLMKHLCRVAEHGTRTGMTARNIAIVWAPNLLRCKELEVGGVAALQGVGVQAVVTEFLITHVEHVFSVVDQQISSQGSSRRIRPKSLSLGTPTKLLSLEEAQVKKNLEPDADNNYIEVGGGPSCLPKKYHTVIELPIRKRSALKRSPLGWKYLFTRNMNSTTSSIRKSASCIESKRKTSVSDEVTNVQKEATSNSDTELKNKLRTVKSAESLSNNSNEPSVRNSIVVNEYLSPPSPKITTTTSALTAAGTGHSRSVSHDSYFDQLAENTPLHLTLQPPDEEGLSDLIVNFDLDESEMKVFSEDESTQIFSNRSSLERFHLLSKQEAKLASSENTITADPSPKKHKTSDNGSFSSITFSDDVTAISNKRSRLEERLSGVDFAFIDSHGGNGGEYIVVEVDVHRDPSIEDDSSGGGGGNGCTEPSGSFVPSPMTDITYSDTLSGYTVSDAVAMNGYTPLSEESYCSDSITDCTKRHYYGRINNNNNNKYENFPRNRHSYQGGEIRCFAGISKSIINSNNNNCSDNRLNSRQTTIIEQSVTNNNSNNDNDNPLFRNGCKSLSDACLIKPRNGSSFSNEKIIPDIGYEYVSTTNNDNRNELTVTVDSSCSSLNEIDNNRYEYVCTSFDSSQSGKDNRSSSSSRYFFKNQPETNHRLSLTIESAPYEPVSVMNNKMLSLSQSDYSDLPTIAADDILVRRRLIDDTTPEIDSNYEDFSKLELSSLDDDRNSDDDDDDDMIENNLYESLIAEDDKSSPELVKRPITYNSSSSIYEKQPAADGDEENFDDDKDNSSYEKFVENDYYEGETCRFLNDNRPLLASEKPSPLSEDERIDGRYSSPSSPSSPAFIRNQQTVSNTDVPLVKSSPERTMYYGNQPDNYRRSMSADQQQHQQLHPCDRKHDNGYSSTITSSQNGSLRRGFKEPSSPLHQALQKLERNSNDEIQTLFDDVPKGQRQTIDDDSEICDDNKEPTMKNVHRLLSKFEWRRPVAGTVETATISTVDESRKRNSDSKLYGSGNNHRSNNDDDDDDNVKAKIADDSNSDKMTRTDSNNYGGRLTSSLETMKSISPTLSGCRLLASSEPSTIVGIGSNITTGVASDDVVVRRERIEKYKEERRLLLRQKYKTDNIQDVNDEREREMIKRFKQKISSSSSSALASNSDVIDNSIGDASGKPIRPKYLALNVIPTGSKVHRLPPPPPPPSTLVYDDDKKQQQDQPSVSSSTSNVTTINILYSPTRNYSSSEEDNNATTNRRNRITASTPVDVSLDNKLTTNTTTTTCISVNAKYNEKPASVVDNNDNNKINRPHDNDNNNDNITNNSKPILYTASLERRKCNVPNDRIESYVAQRVNQLSSTKTTTEDDTTDDAVTISSKNSNPPRPVRRRSYSTSGPVTQYCIRDIAAIFENKYKN